MEGHSVVSEALERTGQTRLGHTHFDDIDIRKLIPDHVLIVSLMPQLFRELKLVAFVVYECCNWLAVTITRDQMSLEKLFVFSDVYLLGNHIL